MKKLLILFTCLMAFGCSVKSTQVTPNLADHLPPKSEWDKEDIWEHNLPGNELPELCPVECVCPNLFSKEHLESLPEDLCKKECNKKKVDYSFEWYTDLPLAAKHAAEEGKLVVAVFVDDSKESKGMLKRFTHPCTRKIVSKHYKAVKVDRETYDLLRQTSEKGLMWQPGDYFMAPSMIILESHKDPGYEFRAYAFPITFQGVPESVCRALKGFWAATR